MLNGHVFKWQRFGNHIFALFIDTFLDGHCGIVNGYKNSMSLTHSGSNVTINSGAICIRGRFLEEDSSTTIDAGTNTLFCKLVVEIDLDKDNTKSEFNQAQYKILVGELGYPALTQEDIVKNNSGKYQYELARFKTGLSGITNFVDKRTFIDFDSIYTELENQSNFVTGIKGNKEGSYRKGNVNLTPANIGALPANGGKLSGLLLPAQDQTYDLGSEGLLWRAIYVKELIFPSGKLHQSSEATVLGVASYFTVRNAFNINNFAPIMASAFNVNSSRRYKKNIREMTEDEAKKVDDIDVVIFDYINEENGTDIAGAIAEDVYKILPGVVTLKEIDGEKVPDSIDYSKFVPYLIRKNQMQEKNIKSQEERISILESLVKQLLGDKE